MSNDREKRLEELQARLVMLTDQLREVEREKTEHSRLIQLLEDDTFNKSETMEHVRSLLAAAQDELRERKHERARLRERVEDAHSEPGVQRALGAARAVGEQLSQLDDQEEEQERMVTPHLQAVLSRVHAGLMAQEVAHRNALNLRSVPPDQPPGSLTIYNGNRRFIMRITPGLTFGEIKHMVSEYFGLTDSAFSLVDDVGAVWPAKGAVRKEFRQLYGPKWQLLLPPLYVRMHPTDPSRLQHMNAYDPFHRRTTIVRESVQSLLMKANPFNTARLLSSYRDKHTFLRHFLAALLYLVLFIFVIFVRRSAKDAMYFTTAVNSVAMRTGFGPFQQRNFATITTVDDAWAWMDGPLRRLLLFEDRSASRFEAPITPPDDERVLLHYGVIMGPVRLRQCRVTNSSCKLSTSLPDEFEQDCFGSYSRRARSEAPFGKLPAGDDQRGFNFTPTSALRYDTSVSLRDATFDGSGFVLDVVPSSPAHWSAEVARLKEGGWIDRATRMVMVAFNVHNANYDVTVAFKYILEFTPGGTILTYNKAHTVHLNLMETLDRFWVSASECGILLMSLVFTFIECKEFLRLKRREDEAQQRVEEGVQLSHRARISWLVYFTDFWNVVETFTLAMYYFNLVIKLVVLFDSRRTATLPYPGYVELAGLGMWSELSFSMDALIVLVLLFKLLKFVALSQRMNMIWLTLAQGAGNIFVFAFMFAIMLLGFVMLAHNVFGAELHQFSRVDTSFRTVLLMLLGPLGDYEQLRRVNRVWAPLYYISFVVLMYMVMMNVFLAIVNHAYRTLKRRYLQEAERGGRGMALSPLEVLCTLFPFVEEILKRLQQRREQQAAYRRRLEASAQLEQQLAAAEERFIRKAALEAGI